MVIAVFRYNSVELGRACSKSFPEPRPKHGVVTEHVPLERWQTAGHRDHDVLSFASGARAVVAGNGACLWHQLGLRLSVGGVVRGMGGSALFS